MPAATPCTAAAQSTSGDASAEAGAGSLTGREGRVLRNKVAGICTTGAIAPTAIQRFRLASAARRNASTASSQATTSITAKPAINIASDIEGAATSERNGNKMNK